ncbi:alpha/beta fold hydrolase, partial [Streptomyces griseiscabiei]
MNAASQVLTRTFQSDDGPLAYLDTGQESGRKAGPGTPLVLLHGGFTDHRMWRDLVPALVAAGHRVIAPDARGHGASANASRPFRLTDDLAAL